MRRSIRNIIFVISFFGMIGAIAYVGYDVSMQVSKVSYDKGYRQALDSMHHRESELFGADSAILINYMKAGMAQDSIENAALWSKSVNGTAKPETK